MPWDIPDEEPITCEGCGCRAYDTDDWHQDPCGTVCQDCVEEEIAA